MKNILILGLLFLLACTSAEEASDPILDSVDIAEQELVQEGDNFTEEDLLAENIDSELDADISAESGEDFSFEDEGLAEESFDEDFFEEDIVDEAIDEGDSEEFAFEDGSDDFALADEGQDTSSDFQVEEEAPLVSDAGQEFNEAPAESFAAATPADSLSSGPVAVTGLDFFANANGGTIKITTDAPAVYSTRKNTENQQFIVEIPNAVLPKKFQRPYNTNEFQGAIGMFQAYQNEGGDVARFVVQLDADQEPMVEQQDNSIMILASNMPDTVTEEAVVAEATAEVEEKVEFEPSVDQQAVANDMKALQEKSIEDYLTGNTKFYGRKINVEVKDWDIRDVFDFIAEQSGLNIVLSEKVEGKITLKLRDIPWDQALMVVMQTKELGYKRQGSILRIAPLQDLKKETDNARALVASQKLLQPTTVKIIPVSYAEAKDLEEQVKDFLTPTRGKVRADERTNSLVITDLPENMEKITKLVASLDTATPQVLIEAKVVEATEEFTRSLGTNLDFSSGGDRVDFNNPVQGAVGAITISSIPNLEAIFTLLETERLVNVLSSPRVLGLNNQQAVITQTNEVAIRQVTVNNGVETVTVNYVPLILQLQVTPQVSSSGSIILQLSLTREFAGGQEGEEGRPLFRRNAQTTIVVDNGETAVIGGIYQNDVADTESGIPWLRRIPILGYLFKTEQIEERKNELMMFVTPRIVNLNEAFTTNSDEEEIMQQQNEFL